MMGEKNNVISRFLRRLFGRKKHQITLEEWCKFLEEEMEKQAGIPPLMRGMNRKPTTATEVSLRLKIFDEQLRRIRRVKKLHCPTCGKVKEKP